MILQGNQRGGARQMANHLLNKEDNEHVEVHEVSGFACDSVHGAFQEIHAVSKGTKCNQFMFSLSLSPPRGAVVSNRQFEEALELVEKKLGLEGQPRVVVFHEKEGRRHAHCVWSRIEADASKAINLPHTKRKLQDVSRELYLQHGWEMPKGFIDPRYRDPRNFSYEEWQQAKRAGEDPRMLKVLFTQAYAQSDSRAALENALKERGFWLAKGDRRGFVAMDYKGEIYSLSRWMDVKPKTLEQRIGCADSLPSVEETKREISALMTENLKRHIQETKEKASKAAEPYRKKVQSMKEKHQDQRKTLVESQRERWQKEESARIARIPKGFKGIWARITGEHKKLRKINEWETQDCRARDADEKQNLVTHQLEERNRLRENMTNLRERTHQRCADLRCDIARYQKMGEPALSSSEGIGTTRSRTQSRATPSMSMAWKG